MKPMPSPLHSLLLFTDEKKAILVLESEGRRLKGIVAKVWAKYLNSYDPVLYKRTTKTRLGMKLGKVKLENPAGIDGIATYQLAITFENDLMYHKSYLGSGQRQGHSLMLISQGWHSKKLEERYKGKRIERFTYYEGFDFFAQVMKEFESGKHNAISLKVVWTGKADYTK